MQLEVLKTTVGREAAVSTENARYTVNYTTVENELKSVRADVYVKKPLPEINAEGSVKAKTREVLEGTLAMDGGVIRNTNFPFSENYSKYVSDFSQIILSILSPASSSESL